MGAQYKMYYIKNMISKWSIFILVALIFILTAHANPTGDTINASEIINQILSNRDWAPSLAKINTTYKVTENGKVTKEGSVDAKIFKKGESIDITYNNKVNDSNGDNNFEVRSIFDGKTFLSRQDVPTPSKVAAYISNDSARITKQISDLGCSYLLGILPETQIDIFKEFSKSSSKLKTQNNEINGISILVIEYNDIDQQSKMWIDPDNFLPIQIEISLTHGNGEDNKPIKTNYKIYDIKYKKYEGKYIPISGKLNQVIAYKYKTQTYDYTTKYELVKFNPDFNKLNAFRMDKIPEDLRIYSLEFPGIRYEWHHGKVMSVVDEYNIKHIDKVVEEKKSQSEATSQISQKAPTPNISHQPKMQKKTYQYKYYIIIAILFFITACIVFFRRSSNKMGKKESEK
jgi:hypothetical protein